MPPRRRAPDVCYEGRITRSRSRGYYSGVDLMGGAQGHHPGDTAFNADRFRNQVPKEVHELVDHHMSKCVKKFEETRPLLEKENRVQANIVDGDQMKRDNEDASPIEAELRNLHVQAGKDYDGYVIGSKSGEDMFTTATTIQHGHRILDNETALKSLLVTSTREISQINLADHQKVGPDEINFYAQKNLCEVCGGVEWKGLLMLCNKCKNTYVHQYCWDTVLYDSTPVYWSCHDCQPKQSVATAEKSSKEVSNQRQPSHAITYFRRRYQQKDITEKEKKSQQMLANRIP